MSDVCKSELEVMKNKNGENDAIFHTYVIV